MTTDLPYQWRICPDGQCHAFPTDQINDTTLNTLQALGACRYSVPRNHTTPRITIPMCLDCDQAIAATTDAVIAAGRREGAPG